LISDRQNLTIVGRRNPIGAGVQQRPVAGILPAPKSGHQRTKFRPEYCWIPAKPAGSGQNGWDPTESGQIQLLIQPDLAKTARIRPDMTRSVQIRKIPAGSSQNGRDPAG
jgi:hypothetical protein